MAEIRSALEIAMEKAERLGRASKEEMDAGQWRDKGRRLAAQYLADEKADLASMAQDQPPSSIHSVLEGAVEVLLRNISLPRDKHQWTTIRKALKGVIQLKGSMARQTTQQIEQLLAQFEKTREHYHQQLKAQLQTRLGGVQQAVAQQYGAAAAARIDVDVLPEFQQEWSRLSAEITQQFERQLIPLKNSLDRL